MKSYEVSHELMPSIINDKMIYSQASRGTLAIPITELRGETQSRLKQYMRSCKDINIEKT